MPVYDDEKEKTLKPSHDGSHDDLGVHPERREAEIDDLERLYNAESGGSKKTEESDTSPEKNNIDSLNTPESNWTTNTNSGSKKWYARLTRRQIVGLGAGGGIIGLLFGLFTIVSGPLQFIHLAQTLQKAHMSDQEESGDNRVSKLFRYAKSGGDLKEARLSGLQSVLYSKAEGKLAAAGIEVLTTDRLKFFDGYAIDPEKYASANNIDPADVPEHAKAKLGVDLDFDTGSGKYIAQASNKFIQDSKLTRAVLQAAGYNKIAAASRSRIISKATGIDWHPLKKVDKYLLTKADEKFAKWEKERKAKTNNGVEDPNATPIEGDEKTDPNPDDETKKPRPDVEDAAKVADDLTPPETAGPLNERVNAVRGNGVFKAGAVGVGIIGLTCAVQAVSKKVDEAVYINKVLPLIRMGMEAITVGNQVMSNKDIDIDQLNFYSKYLKDPKTKQSWVAARSIQAEQGQKLTGPDVPAEARIDEEGNAVTQFFNRLGFVKTICEAANSGIGQVISFAADVIAGGPISAIGGQAISTLLGPVLFESITNMLAGEVLDVNGYKGPAFGNIVNYGARHAANTSYIAAGGTKLSTQQAKELRLAVKSIERQDTANKSIAKRVFDPYDANSVIASFIDKQDPEPGQNLALMIKKTASIFNTLPKSIGSIFTGRIFADVDQSYDYGFSKYGFSVQDLEDPAVKNPYTNAEAAAKILKGSKGQKYINRAKTCFGVTLSPDGSTKPPDAVAEYSKIDEENCTDNSKEWRRIRFMIFDTQLAEGLACYEGANDSCANIGFSGSESGGNSTQNPTPTTPGSSGIVGNPGDSSVDVACAPGTLDLGVHTGYQSGNPVEHRLCAIPNIPCGNEECTPGTRYYVKNDQTGQGAEGKAIVNSRVSGAWFALANEAAGAGVQIKAVSTFRTMKHQQDLFARNPNSEAVAPPGTSAHQSGQAIDLNLGTGLDPKKNAQSCSNRQTQRGNPVWDWMLANADKYGIKQYSAEAWHWDTFNLSNRCTSTQI